MAHTSDLQTRFCVEWKTKLPSFGATLISPSFDFQEIECNVKLNRSAINQPGWFYLNLHITRGVSLRRRFWITTLFGKDDVEKRPIVCSIREIHGTDLASLWQFTMDNLWGIAPRYERDDHFKIVCILECDLACPPVTHSSKETVNSSESPESFDLPPNLESLSTDLSKLLEDNDLPDVKLKCEDRAISAHRAVLAARSEVFAAMFRHKMLERETGVVDVADMNTQVLKLFLRYVYTGQIQGLSKELVHSLYVAGDKYAVHGLKTACSDRMIASLTEDNCLSFLTFADAHGDADFKDAVVFFICGHEEILQSDAWLSFSEKHWKLATEVYQSFVRLKGRADVSNQ